MHEKKKNPTQEWLNVLPQLATRLEISLYRSAPSFDVYNDISTFRQRTQQLIKRMQQASARRRQESDQRRQEFEQRRAQLQRELAQQQQVFAQQQQAFAQQLPLPPPLPNNFNQLQYPPIIQLSATSARVLHDAVISVLQNPNNVNLNSEQQVAAHGLSAILGCVRGAVVNHKRQEKWANTKAKRDLTTIKKRKLREEEKGDMMLPESKFEDEEDRIAFEGIPNHFYRNEILPLKKGSSTEFIYASMPILLTKAARSGGKHQTLDLDKEYFTNLGRKRIGQFIVGNKNLKTLKVNAVDEGTIPKIFKAGGHPSIEKMVISLQCTGSTAMSGANHLFNSIRTTPLLRSLEISGQVDISKHGLGLLGLALEGKPLEYLRFAGETTTTYQTIKPLLAPLDATVLKHLNLGSVSVGVDSCEGIAGLLAHPKSAVTKVCVESIENEESVQVISTSLSRNTTLQSLNIRGGRSTLSEESRDIINELVFGTSSIQSVWNANHILRKFGGTIMINNQRVDGDIDLSDSIINDSPQDLAMRRRKKLVKFLTLDGGFNMEPFLDIEEVELMPYALAFIGKQSNQVMPDFGYCAWKKEEYMKLKHFDDIPLDGMYEVLRYWQMPVLYERA